MPYILFFARAVASLSLSLTTRSRTYLYLFVVCANERTNVFPHSHTESKQPMQVLSREKEIIIMMRDLNR